MKKTGWWKIAVVAVLVIAVVGVIQLKAKQSAAIQSGQNSGAIASPGETPSSPAPEPVEDTTATPPRDGAPAKTAATASNTTAESLGPQAPTKGGTGKETSKTSNAATAGTSASPTPKPAPVKAAAVKKATFIELGADQCVPCKMMQPIMDELRQEYPDTLEVVFHDVWKDQSIAEKYGIRSIPTQVLLDGDGKEIFRHVGFWPKDDIVAKYKELGINLK